MCKESRIYDLFIFITNAETSWYSHFIENDTEKVIAEF